MKRLFMFFLFSGLLIAAPCYSGARQIAAGAGASTSLDTTATNPNGCAAATLFFVRESCYNNSGSAVVPAPVDSSGNTYTQITLPNPPSGSRGGIQITLWYKLKPTNSTTETWTMGACGDSYGGVLQVAAFDTVTTLDSGSVGGTQSGVSTVVATPIFTPVVSELVLAVLGVYCTNTWSTTPTMTVAVSTISGATPDGQLAYLLSSGASPFTVSFSTLGGCSPFPTAAIAAFYVSSGHIHHGVAE